MTPALDRKPRSIPELRADLAERIREQHRFDRRACAHLHLHDMLAIAREWDQTYRGEAASAGRRTPGGR